MLKGIIHRTIGPPRWGIGYHRWFFGLVRFSAEIARPPDTNPTPRHECLCGAPGGRSCRHADGRCTSMNHPTVRARIQDDYGG